MPRHKYSLVACARWEETQIQEWIEYHRSIGFDHIYLYSNDDDPAALFKAVAAYVHGRDPFVTFRHWPVAGQQRPIYFHFMETYKHETEWFSFLDIDEFFVLKGVDDIHRFMQDYRDSVDCLYFNWFIYGNCDRKQRADTPTLTTYLRRARSVDVHTKMICRAASIDANAVRKGLEAGLGAFWHFLDKYRLPGVRCRDVLHDPTDGYAEDFPASSASFVNRPGFSDAVLNKAYVAHFQFRSEDDFLRRWRRGGFPAAELWRGVYQAGAHRELLAKSNEVYDPYLADYWYRYTEAGLRFSLQPYHPTLRLWNVALNKPSWQSSELDRTIPIPDGCRTSGAGNNGVRHGGYGVHTESEPRPWWIVDLLAVHEIVEIHIYIQNDTADAAHETDDLDVFGSGDGAGWTLLNSQGSEPFRAAGPPWVAQPSSGGAYRFIMLRRRGAGYLHLNEVEVYGRLSDRTIPLVGTALAPDMSG